MDNKRKIEILKEMKGMISSGLDSCLCNALFTADRDLWEKDNSLEKLGISKPRTAKKYAPYWYEQYDRKPRIRAINKAIKKLQSK